tara:strand:- start:14945 stop:15223 length:279 start_codon:yes stop_codon:yes gene_type:complete
LKKLIKSCLAHTITLRFFKICKEYHWPEPKLKSSLAEAKNLIDWELRGKSINYEDKDEYEKVVTWLSGALADIYSETLPELQYRLDQKNRSA